MCARRPVHSAHEGNDRIYAPSPRGSELIKEQRDPRAMRLAQKFGRISIDTNGLISGSGGNENAGLCIVELDGRPIGSATWHDYQVAYTARRPLKYGPYLPPEARVAVTSEV